MDILIYILEDGLDFCMTTCVAQQTASSRSGRSHDFCVCDVMSLCSSRRGLLTWNILKALVPVILVEYVDSLVLLYMSR